MSIRRSKSIVVALSLALLVALLATACGGSSSSAPRDTATSIRVAFFPNVTNAQPIVGLKQGLFQQELGSVRIDTKQFNAGPAEVEALFAGEVDIGYIGPSPATTGYVQSQGDALRIVAGSSSGGASFVVRADAGINGPQDLHGKRVASPQLGNTQDIALRVYLKAQGLKRDDEGGDVKVTPLANSDIFNLFQKKNLDAAWVPEPWATRLVREANGRILFDERTLWPNGQFATTVVIVRRAFLEQNPGLVKKWLIGQVKTTQWLNANKPEAQAVLKQELDRLTGAANSPEGIADAFSRTDFTYDPLETTVQKAAQSAKNLGFLKGDIKLDNLVQLTLLNEVLADLKLAKVGK